MGRGLRICCEGAQNTGKSNHSDGPESESVHRPPFESYDWLNRLEPHNVVAAIYVNHFTRDPAAGVGGEKNSRGTHFFDFYTAA
jgi:hypothetical protein